MMRRRGEDGSGGRVISMGRTGGGQQQRVTKRAGDRHRRRPPPRLSHGPIGLGEGGGVDQRNPMTSTTLTTMVS